MLWQSFRFHLTLKVLVTAAMKKDKGTGICLRVQTCITMHVLQTLTFPLARWQPMQSAPIDPTLDLCTRYKLHLGCPRQCGMQSFLNISIHNLDWESNSSPFDLEINALSTHCRLHIWPETLLCNWIHISLLTELALYSLQRIPIELTDTSQLTPGLNAYTSLVTVKFDSKDL